MLSVRSCTRRSIIQISNLIFRMARDSPPAGSSGDLGDRHIAPLSINADVDLS